MSAPAAGASATIEPDELAARLERAEPLQVLDIRAPVRAALGHVEARDYVNVPGSELGRLGDPARAGLRRELPVAVICDRGISSVPVTRWMRELGYDARSLAGGMLGWTRVLVPRDVAALAGLDRLVQLDRVGKGALGYLAIRGGEALAVDPGRDLEVWEQALHASGAKLVAVVDTHCHADYLSGGPELARRHRVAYRLHPSDARDPFEGHAARLPFTPLADAEALRVGDAAFEVEHRPGHTEGSVVLRLGDELALTGDLLFVESVGRPDLADRTAAWTEALQASLDAIRARWPAALRVFPAHYLAESERSPSRVVEARFDELAARNAPFALADPAAFRAWIGARAGTYPEAYRWIKLANLGLAELDEATAEELEAGKSQCALAG